MAPTDTPRLNELFSLLSNHRRRYILYHLTSTSTVRDLTDLAERIAVWEANDTTTDVSDDLVQSVELSLYHIHLPKLADAGLITYEQTQGIIELSELDEVGPFLEEAAPTDRQLLTVADG